MAVDGERHGAGEILKRIVSFMDGVKNCRRIGIKTQAFLIFIG